MSSGVYAAWAFVQDQKQPAALVISSLISKVEVYLLEYTGPSLYETTLQVEPQGKVSEIESLQGEALQEKIARDIVAVRALLSKK